MGRPRTLYEKIWDAHVVERRDDGTCLIYIDRHLVHEVTSPQAFEGLRVAGRRVRRPDLTLAVPDHNLPTTPRVDAHGRALPIAEFSRGRPGASDPCIASCATMNSPTDSQHCSAAITITSGSVAHSIRSTNIAVMCSVSHTATIAAASDIPISVCDDRRGRDRAASISR